MLSGHEALNNATGVIIAEGYSTAATLRDAFNKMDMPNVVAVAAVDAGNLRPVAQAVHAKFPDMPIVIAGDNDLHLLQDSRIQKNRGWDAAQDAAKAVDGKAIRPVFGTDKPDKTQTDFNDLARKSGLDTVQRQLYSAKKYIETAREAKKVIEITKDRQKTTNRVQERGRPAPPKKDKEQNMSR